MAECFRIVSCPSYVPTLLAGVSKIKNQFCDVTIIAAGQRFRGHKAILAANSNYFYSIFAEAFREREAEEIRMPQEIDSKAIEILLDYFYSGKLALSMGNIESVFVATDYMRLDAVLEISIGFMEETLDPSNCIRRFVMAARMEYSSPQMEGFRKAASTLIVEEAVNGSGTTEFFSLSSEHMLKIIQSASESAEAESLYRAIVKWVGHDQDSRRQVLYDLLQALPVNRISDDFFVSQISNDELVIGYIEGAGWVIQNTVSRLRSHSVTQNAPSSSGSLASGRHSPQPGPSGGMQSVSPGPVLGYQPNALFIAHGGQSQMCWNLTLANPTPLAICERPEIQSFSIVSHQSRIYLLCGYKTEHAYQLDGPQGSWADCEFNFQFRRQNAGCVVLGDDLFVIGGYDWRNKSTLSSCVKFTFGSGLRENLPSMSEARNGPGVAAYANSVYATCGKNASPSIERFDAREGRWCVVGQYAEDISRCISASATVSDSLFTCCLKNGRVQGFNFRTNRAQTVCSLPSSLCYKWISSVNRDLFGAVQGNIFKYDEVADRWIQFSSGIDPNRPIMVPWRG